MLNLNRICETVCEVHRKVHLRPFGFAPNPLRDVGIMEFKINL
jgi:hypothetical protein